MSYGASPAIRDHTVFQARERASPFPSRLMLDFPIPEGWRGELVLVLVTT